MGATPRIAVQRSPTYNRVTLKRDDDHKGIVVLGPPAGDLIMRFWIGIERRDSILDAFIINSADGVEVVRFCAADDD